MQIEQKILDALRPYERNAKEHSKKQIIQIANSIREFGFSQPIVADKEGTIIVGHGRYQAAKYLDLKTVPVLTLNLTDEQARAYRLADNKLNESDWDMQSVIAELKDLSLPMIDLTGFSCDLALELEDKDDLVPALPAKPRSIIGDFYELGDHKLLCGDATLEDSYAKLLGTTKADMIFTDPPYNVNYKGQGKNTKQGIANDNMSEAAFSEFLQFTFKQMRSAIKGGGGAYVFHSTSTQAQFEVAMRASEFEIRNQLIWNKPMAALGWGDYRWKHEPFYYAGIKGSKTNFYGNRTHATVVDFTKSDQELLAWAKKMRQAEREGKMTVWTMKRESVIDYVHPTQKPVELIIYALANSSKEGDIVLDPFMGSGSTIIACEKAKRMAVGMELDPKYVDVIVQRYCEFTENNKIKKNGKEIEW
jgi:site-specific DNA-methyltransferase (adenine-specific)